MDVDLIFKIAAIGIIVAVLNQVLIRSGREEQAMMTTLAGLIVVLMMIINEINTLFETVKTIFGLGLAIYYGMDRYDRYWPSRYGNCCTIKTI